QNVRANVMEALSGVKGDNSVKIFGPDLVKLEELAQKVKARLVAVRGVENVGIFRIMGQSNLEFRVDPRKCQLWGVSAADVNMVIKTAVGGQPFTQMIEGEKTFDITLRWPQRLRGSVDKILDIPVDVTNNTVTSGSQPSSGQTPTTGPSTGVSGSGTSIAPPTLFGSTLNTLYNPVSTTPRPRLPDLVSPVGAHRPPHPTG